jgi:hypothetical protein
MGRWGDGIYDSDSALDYFETIDNVLKREINYWCLPEKVREHPTWLENVLAVVEVMLLFDLHEIGGSLYLDAPQAVDRWREAFVRVWDGDWTGDEHYHHLPYYSPDYRKQHRPGVAALFDHLKGIAEDCTAVNRNDTQTTIAPLHPDYPLPYFSLQRLTNRKGEPMAHTADFIVDLIDARTQEITYWLAYDDWGYMDEDELPVSADVLGFLCEIYDKGPSVSDEVVRNWRAAALKLWGDSIGDRWNDSDPMYQNIVKSFERLEAMAKKYPPRKW